MDHFDMAQALRDKAGISYEEARQALEQANWDILEAMVALEKAGRLGARAEQPDGTQAEKPADKNSGGKAGGAKEGWLNRFIAWVKALVDKGNRSKVLAMKDGRAVSQAPVTVAVVLFLFFNGLFVFGVLVALLAGYRFRYESERGIAGREKDIREGEEAAEQLRDYHTVNSFPGAR